MKSLSLLAAAALVLLTAGCEKPKPAGPSVTLGKPCTVYLRHDAVGEKALPSSKLSPLSPLTALTGIARATTENSITLDSDGKLLWIPIGVVSAISQE